MPQTGYGVGHPTASHSPPRALLGSWHSLLWCDGSDLSVSALRGAEVLREATRAWGWGKILWATQDGLGQQQPPEQAGGWLGES